MENQTNNKQSIRWIAFKLAFKPVLFLYSFIIFLPFLFLNINTKNFSISGNVILFLFIFIFLLFISLSKKILKAKGLLMKNFAVKLAYNYSEEGGSSTVLGEFFKHGFRNEISNVLSSKDATIRIFMYLQQRDRFRNAKFDRKFTVFEYTFANKLPRISLRGLAPFHYIPNNDSFSRYFPKSETFFGNSEQLSFGEMFDNLFSVSVEKEFEQESFEILTPDFIQVLLEHCTSFGLEIYENKLYFFVPKFIDSEDELSEWFSIFTILYEKIKPKAKQVSRYVKAMNDITEGK